jgi:hypothetical protein
MTPAPQTPETPEEPDLPTRVGHLLEDLYRLFGDLNAIAAETRPDPVTRRLLPAWVRSLECAVRRLLVMAALRLLANGAIILGLSRRTREDRPALHRPYRPRQATPHIGLGGAAAAPQRSSRRRPLSAAPDADSQSHQDPAAATPALFPAAAWARRVLAAAAILSDPEAWARRLARRIARAGINAVWSPALSSETPETDRAGYRTPYLFLLEDLALAMRAAVEAHDWPSPRDSPCR